MRLPNFLVIGAPKCGTTSLFYYLRQHPDIYLPLRKELHYFAYSQLRERSFGPGDEAVLLSLCATWKDYKNHYKQAGLQPAVGEVSPSYLYYSDVSGRIQAELGEVKIIVILRDPVEKAYSQYMHMIRERREPLGFYEALQAEGVRRENKWSDIWSYAESSLYSNRLQKYISVFGRENVKALLFEDLANHPQKVLADVFRFLGIDTSFLCDTTKVYNRTGKPRSGLIADFLAKPNNVKTLVKRMVPERIRIPLRLALLDWNTGDKTAMDQRSSEYLRNYFAEDVRKLESMLAISLHWNGTTEVLTK